MPLISQSCASRRAGPRCWRPSQAPWQRGAWEVRDFRGRGWGGPELSIAVWTHLSVGITGTATPVRLSGILALSLYPSVPVSPCPSSFCSSFYEVKYGCTAGWHAGNNSRCLAAAVPLGSLPKWLTSSAWALCLLI